MIKVLTYFFLGLYLSVVFKPIEPLLMDVLAHSFWYVKHMGTVHHHHGNDHAQMEIEKSSDQNEEIPVKNKGKEPVLIHLSLQKEMIFNDHISTDTNYGYFNSDLSESTIQVNIPPPKV